jgi:hypothetical protein
MAYYPKSQVKTDLYTNGNEYVYDGTQQEYIGYYYTVSSGKKYTGKNPNIVPTYLLALLPTTEIGLDNAPDGSLTAQRTPTVIEITPNSTYTPGNAQTRIIPQFSSPQPKPEDKKRGFFIRYFCKKNNELIYFETSQADHDRIKSQDPTTAYDLYSAASLKWYITGDPSQVTSQNITQINEVSSTNGWLGFIQYFKGDFNRYLGT